MRLKIAAFGVLMASATLVAGAGAAVAAAPPPVGAHHHYILVNEAKVYVGPNFCAIPASEQGFAAFHAKVHLTDPGLVDVRAERCPS